MWKEFTTATPVYSAPILRYAATGSYGPIEIPLIITEYKVPTRSAKTTTTTALPLINTSNTFNYGGSKILQGASDLPKLQIAGTVDTPSVDVGGAQLPNIFRGSNRVFYGEIIVMNAEGRGSSATTLTRVDPEYFIDPYGRVFNSPRLLEYTFSWVEGAPFRQNFNITMLLTRGSN